MSSSTLSGFPLFPLGIVALPGEGIPLHIFEDRYLRMIEHCLAGEEEGLGRSFGVLWLSDEELKEVGAACEVEEILARTDDGHMDILARGGAPFRLLQREENLPYPAGVIELLDDAREELDETAAAAARRLYAELVRQATDREIEPGELATLSAYRMAATVEFPTAVKQELLELRSENRRMALLAGLLESAIERLSRLEHAQARARSNGKVSLS